MPDEFRGGPFVIVDARTIHALPAFGDAGVCLDYDEDCFLLSGPGRVQCWLYQPDPERGICPFMD